MRKGWISLGMLVLLTACSRAVLPEYQPTTVGADLETWAERYPQEYLEWADSVHGQAYLEGDGYAPGCTDCHADPETGEIRTTAFHLDIPNRCARCHADADMMGGYEIAANVYDTYLADYHGATINYYRMAEPDTYRFEAVCSDCHGNHEIYPADVENSSVADINLEDTCERCHAQASYSFTLAYGHYNSTRAPVILEKDTPIIYWVKLFYQALIPLIMGGMVFYVALDIRHRWKKGKNQDD